MSTGFMWDALRWTISVPLAILGVLAIVGNLTALVMVFMRRWQGSLIPLVGGVFLSVAMLICPMPGLARYAWLPLVIDPACGLNLTLLALFLLKHWLKSLAR